MILWFQNFFTYTSKNLHFLKQSLILQNIALYTYEEVINWLHFVFLDLYIIHKSGFAKTMAMRLSDLSPYMS